MSTTEVIASPEPLYAGFRGDEFLTNFIFGLIASLGIVGNGLVLLVFYKARELHVSPNIIIGHQSFVDLISSIFLLLSFIPSKIDLLPMSLNKPILANLICKIWVSRFVYWAMLKASTTNLVFLTIERYFAVVHPIKYRKRAKRGTSATACVLAWIVGLSVESYNLWMYRISEGGKCVCNEVLETGSVERYVIAFVTIITTLFIPVVVMTYVYGYIIWTLRSNKFQLSTKVQQSVRNAFVTMVFVSVTYIICWTPYMVLFFHHNVVTRNDWTDWIHEFALFLALSNVCVNPFIYAVKFQNFQRGLKTILQEAVSMIISKDVSQ